ncbi:MAG: hypothetical protein J7L15_00915 [Clostridiales bacterium]|nr:hypothetical protein [Clostridiales bacterium]
MIKRLYLHLEAGYVWGKGYSDEKQVIFEAEIKEIMTKLGWDRWSKSMPMSALECFRNDYERAYCHPMTIVITVEENHIMDIVEALSNAINFTLRYHKVYDIEDKDKNYFDNIIRKRIPKKI